jgi:hypothetical protein
LGYAGFATIGDQARPFYSNSFTHTSKYLEYREEVLIYYPSNDCTGRNEIYIGINRYKFLKVET